MSDPQTPKSDPSDPGRNPDGSVLVKASKQGGARPAHPDREVADAATLAEIRAAIEKAEKDLSPAEAAALGAIRKGPRPNVQQVCYVEAEYTAGDLLTRTSDPDSPLAQAWAQKGLRVFVKAVKPDGTVIGMRTMTGTAAIEAMQTALSGRMVQL